jgi:hypothetical protein
MLPVAKVIANFLDKVRGNAVAAQPAANAGLSGDALLAQQAQEALAVGLNEAAAKITAMEGTIAAKDATIAALTAERDAIKKELCDALAGIDAKVSAAKATASAEMAARMGSTEPVKATPGPGSHNLRTYEGRAAANAERFAELTTRR